MALVNVEHVSRVYRQDSIAVKALDDVSMTIEAGEFTTLVGPSGSGKTTLLNQIGALDEPSAGKIQIDGQEITGRAAGNEPTCGCGRSVWCSRNTT